MKETIAYYIFTVDDEDPKCSHCSRVDANENYCERHCGPSHGWNGYERIERKEK